MKKEKNPGDIEIILVKDWPAEDIIKLYKAGGWIDGSENEALIKKIISGSYAFAVAVDEETGKAVGMGRVLSDGVSDAYIQDVVILPEYRKLGTGKKIIQALRDHCIRNKINWVALVAEEGTQDFYFGLGFKAMKGHTPMKYETKK